MQQEKPEQTISIVSVALNAERTIRRTIESVVAQCPKVDEYIVIDGASTDRTADIVREYGAAVTKFICAPDEGIYDAMNVGLRAATSEIVGFLNANDALARSDGLARIRDVMSDRRIDGCYGHLDFVSLSGRVVRRWRSSRFEPGLLQNGWAPPHPTFYCRRKLMLEAGGFKKHYRIAGDYELFIRLLAIRKIRVEFIPEVLVKMEAGGVSNGSLRNIISGNREVMQAWKENGLSPPPLIGLRKPIAKVLQLRPTW